MIESENAERILAELREQTKWLKFLALPALLSILEETLKTKEQIAIFSLSNGENSTNDISKKLSANSIKVSHMTVYNYWKRWYALGLVVPSSKYKGRFEKIIDLEELNLGKSP